MSDWMLALLVAAPLLGIVVMWYLLKRQMRKESEWIQRRNAELDAENELKRQRARLGRLE